jgi:hypothetical protein
VARSGQRRALWRGSAAAAGVGALGRGDFYAWHRLAPADLADPLLLDESRAALEAIGQVLNLGPVHDFQRI